MSHNQHALWATAMLVTVYSLDSRDTVLTKDVLYEVCSEASGMSMSSFATCVKTLVQLGWVSIDEDKVFITESGRHAAANTDETLCRVESNDPN